MSDTDPGPPVPPRYSRQVLFKPIGAAGQRRLLASRVTLVGCGALGSVLANTLVRSGVGFLRIVDRDYLELDNLQRQVLFNEDDLAAGLPKAEAARRALARINSEVRVEAVVTDANASNVEALCEGAHLILDGTDNFETRFLMNDVAVKHGVPWVYGACVAAEGLVMPILPRETPCLRCIWEEAPPPGVSPTCDTAGVLSTVVNLVASFQAAHAIKILIGRKDELNRDLLTIDGWACRVRGIDMQSARETGDCTCCKRGRYEFLERRGEAQSTALCGRNAVQVFPQRAAADRAAPLDFGALASRLGPECDARFNAYLLRFRAGACEVTVFADGRAIVKGTADPTAARVIYSRYIGN